MKSLIGTPLALAALIFGWQPTVALMHHPAAFLWLLAVAVVLVIGGLFLALIAARSAEPAPCERCEALETVVAELDQENARLHMELTEAQLLSGETVRVPLLTIVPQSEEVTAAEWPAIMRAVEGEVES